MGPWRRRVLDLAAGKGGVELVDGHRQVPLRPGALGEADVVGVAVGQHDRPDVVEAPAHRGQLREQLRPVARHPRVDDRDGPGFLEEVGVDQAAAEPMESRGDPHRPIVPASIR